MLFPLVVAFSAVGLGTWLALGPAEGTLWVRPIRVVAIVAAVVVVVTHLLPEAFHDLGAKALGGFLAGLSLPWLTEAVGTAIGRARTGLAPHDHGGVQPALEIAYVGLVAHRFGDGLSMGAAAHTHPSAPPSPWTGAGVVLAIAAHIVPVTAVMLLAFSNLKGRRSALLRGAGLAASTGLGVVSASAALSGGLSSAEPWVSAVVAGLLLHIVAHDVPVGKRNPPLTEPD